MSSAAFAVPDRALVLDRYRPLKPLGRGWQAAWWVMVGLAVVSVFVEILRSFLPLLLIVILWGYWMDRYRRKRGVQ